jgi:hypothetical protein
VLRVVVGSQVQDLEVASISPSRCASPGRGFAGALGVKVEDALWRPA